MATFEDIVGRMRAAAEPTRLRMLRLLQNDEYNVKDLTQLLGHSQPRVSRHIKLLSDAGLIERYQEGSWVFVRASQDPQIRGFLAKALAMIDETDAQVQRDAERAQQVRARRAELAQAYFDRNAARWDEIRALHVSEEAVEAAMRDALGEGPFELIVDTGTGTGRILEVFADRARRLVGIDTNREMLKCARVRLEKAGLSHCAVRNADVCDLPFPDNTADAIIFHQVLHYLETPKAALFEAVRVLKPGGLLLVVDFAPHNEEFLREEHKHVRLGFGAREVAAWLAEAGTRHKHYRELKAEPQAERKLTVALWLAQKSPSATGASGKGNGP